MFAVRCASAAIAAAMLLAPAAVSAALKDTAVPASPGTAVMRDAASTIVTIETRAGARHQFRVELARTGEEQSRGLMFRTGIPADGGMLFAPYPGDGGPPREASFWMVNTPTPLDILFIRADGTIARIAADAEPFSDARLESGEPVGAVLEVNAGRCAALGIAEGDKVSWASRGG